MAIQFTFNSQQVGDHYLKVEPADRPLTPPVTGTGLFQQTARVNADSRNHLHMRVFFVALFRNSTVALDQAVAALQDLQGQSGDLQVSEGTDAMLCVDWVVQEVSRPSLPKGFGGRFCQELAITCVGATPPQYS